LKKKKNNSVLDLPLNPPEPCPSSSAYSALVAEVTAGLPVSEARHYKGLTYIEYRTEKDAYSILYSYIFSTCMETRYVDRKILTRSIVADLFLAFHTG
jgi:hypothetical protein